MKVGEFPRIRPRRLRLSKNIREIVAETRLHPSMFMLPVFLNENVERPVETPSLKGHYYYSPQSPELVKLIGEALDLGVRSFLLFGIPSHKDFYGSQAWSKEGVVQKAVRFLRKELGWEPIIFSDLCLCGYTDHGHCGIPKQTARGTVIDNDSTLEFYGRIAVSQAEAGVDFVAPSGMMDGQVSAIRRALDEAGFSDVGIMAYSAKYASGFYGPFRTVMDSAPRFGDRRSYQMDPRNAKEALKEAIMDVIEGADIIMVKPALAYLDVIALIKNNLPHVPLAAYNVSGEYAMVKAAGAAGVIDEKIVMMEVLTAIARAGADIIITYHAIEASRVIKEGFSF
ncbi:MAG: porphobilinogen synthase [Acidilobaceae archaeon]